MMQWGRSSEFAWHSSSLSSRVRREWIGIIFSVTLLYTLFIDNLFQLPPYMGILLPANRLSAASFFACGSLPQPTLRLGRTDRGRTLPRDRGALNSGLCPSSMITPSVDR